MGYTTPMITLIIPVFNEELALKQTLDTAKKTLESSGYDHEIIVVNDGSTDATELILQQYSNHAPFKIITHAENKGNGASIVSGIKAATGETLCTIDADGTYPIDQIPRLLNTFFEQQADMVVGKRAKENDETGFIHRTAAQFLNLFGSIMSWYHIPDINSGQRIFKKSIAEEYVHMYPSTFSFHIVLTLSMLINGKRVLYSNIDYYPRIGESKLSSGLRGPTNFVKFLWLICTTGFYWRPIYVGSSSAAVALLLWITIH